MIEYIEFGSTPSDENCAQIGQEDYKRQAIDECVRYKRQLEHLFEPIPCGMYFAVKSFEHDFGRYYEVCLFYDPQIEDHLNVMLNIEGNLPARWEPEL